MALLASSVVVFGGATFFSIVVVEATLWRRLCTMGVRSPKADLRRAKSRDDVSKGLASCSVAYRDRSALWGSSAFQWSLRNPVLGGGALLAFSFCDEGVAFVVGTRIGVLT
jgi:hypothetical protein